MACSTRVALALIASTLGGCGKNPTTAQEAERTVSNCGIPPDDILWQVTDDGTFAFGSKQPGGPGPSSEQSQCLIKWAQSKNVELGFMGHDRFLAPAPKSQ